MRGKLTLSLVCLLLVAGCSEADVTAHDSDNGGHVTIDKGEIFDIVLADDYQTSNCQWHDEEKHDFAILKHLGSRYQPGQPAPGATSGGTFTSRYQAVAAGTAHVTLVQEDNANHVARRFALDVTVR
jgi:predicted secreted protein